MPRKPGSKSAARLESGAIALEYDLKKGLYKVTDSGKPLIENAAWEVVAAQTIRSTDAGAAIAVKKKFLKSPLGQGEDIIVTHAPKALKGRKVIFRARVWEKIPGSLAVCVEFPLTPTDAPLMEINALVASPANNAAVRVPGEDGAPGAMLSSGYQSWDHSTTLGLAEGIDRGSWFFTCLAGSDESHALVLAQLTADSAETCFQRHSAESSPTPSAEASTARDFCARTRLRLLRPTKAHTRTSEWIYIGLDAGAQFALDKWAALYSQYNRIKFPGHVPAGYCTWYIFQRLLSSDIIRRNIASQAAHLKNFGYSIYQVDDGATSWHGDWLETHERLKGITLEGICREAKKRGLTPGLWLTPFMISERSKIFKEHPELFAKNDDGSPQTTAFKWADELCYIMDGSHPKARKWMTEQFRALHEDVGNDYFKLDFCFNATDARHLHDPNATATEAYRQMMKAVRQGAGRDTFILGCGTPLAASAGCFDGLRIGPDTGWTVDERDKTKPLVSTWPQMSWALSNVAARACTHGFLWINDPDCVMARGRKNLLTFAERRTLASTMALSGGMVLASDDLPDLEPEEIDLLRRIAPAAGEAGWCADLIAHEGTFPGVWVQPQRAAGEEWRVIALSNRSNETRAERLPFGDGTGLRPGVFYHLWEFWSGKYWGTVCDDETFFVPPHDTVVFGVRAALDIPQLIAIDRHIGQGAVEIAELKLEEKQSRIKGRVRPIGAEKMTLWFNFPAGTTPAYYECPKATGRLVEGDAPGVWGLELAFKEKAVQKPEAEWAFTMAWAPGPEKEVDLNAALPKKIKIAVKSATGATIEWSAPRRAAERPNAWRVTVAEGRRFSSAKVIQSGLVKSPAIALGGLRGGAAYTTRIAAVGAWGEESEKGATITFKTAKAPRRVCLSDLPGVSCSTPGGIIDRDRDFLLAPLKAGKKTFKRGLIVLAGSDLQIDLPGDYKSVSGWFSLPRKDLGTIILPDLALEIYAQDAAKKFTKRIGSVPETPAGGDAVPFKARIPGRATRLIFKVRRAAGFDHMAHWQIGDARLE